MNKLILGIDAGNFMAKVVGPFGTDFYKTNICDWFERKVDEAFGNDDMEFEIDGRKGFAGSIAAAEDDYGTGSMYGDSKAHEDTKIRVLLAIYRYLNRYCPHFKDIYVVTGQPIINHKPEDKNAICDMLEGFHEFTVNGRSVSFTIEKVGVAPEGSGAYWSNPQGGTIRILDIGSGTVNAATIIEKKHINNSSNTFNFGMETVKNKNDLQGISRGIVRSTSTLKWKKEDRVLICGGVAAGIHPFLSEHYQHAEILKPTMRRGDNISILDPVFANAAGFYALGKGAFG